jgi:pimeloyl-ACP methyl ester carboxylesterase
MTTRGVGTVALALLCMLAGGARSASAATYAPLDAPGPALLVPTAQLASALSCSAGVVHASRAPVLLVPGTGANVKDNWSWTYEPALAKLRIPWCAVNLPQNGTSDIQVAGDYIVYAIRTMYARAGRRIAIIGHSQGGMVPRWALRFWPDTRAMVDDMIGFAPSNHGTTQARGTCKQQCSAADWQQRDDSRFIAAVNSYAETFPGISYTVVYTHTDEVVQPNTSDHGSSSLHGGGGQITNVATQQICPADVYEHLAIGTIDPVAYALAIDALDHPGPANPARIGRRVCTQTLQPGVNPATFPQNAAAAAVDVETYPSVQIPAEPALRCYVTATCPPTVRLSLTVAPGLVRAGRLVRLALTVRAGTVPLGSALPVAGALVSFHRYTARTDRNGNAELTLRFVKLGPRPLSATAAGYLPAVATVRVLAARARTRISRTGARTTRTVARAPR